MSLENRKKAVKLLLGIIVTSLLVMGLATWFYFHKGLEKLEDPDYPKQSYYVNI